MATTHPDTSVTPVVTTEQLLGARAIIDKIYVDPKVRDYAIDLVRATRKPSDFGVQLDRFVRYGASPRASINLILAARARAFLAGRAYVSPHDLKALAADVLRHRIGLTYEAEAQGVDTEAVIQALLDTLPTP